MSNFEKLQDRLAAGETILMDGGMGSEIERRGLISPTTWSGGPMLTHPDAVRDIHQEYIEAGAEIIITNTFGTGRDMLEEGGIEDKVTEANRLGIEAAVQARRNAGADESVVIAASVSTMRPKAHAEVPVPYETALATYREQLDELAKGGADVVVGEMLVRISDTLAVIDAATELGLPVWVGLSLVRDGDGLYLGIQDRHGGETLQDALDAIKDKGVAAVFVMHTPVDDTGPGLEIVRQSWPGIFGAYAHFPRSASPPSQPNATDPQSYLEYAKGWSEQGARIIGGCCGTRPDHIQVLKEWLSGS
ncbi:MAG: homocysteine S-methyltransferase family protein [Chloroflexi bacterium]|nr:homocysteine S-methyltransferase family protein [Chloroflexota bacterium]